MDISLELIIALIGAITGVASLILHIIKERPNLKLETAFFEWESKHNPKKFHGQWIRLELNLRNLSNLSTTIEKIYAYIGNQVLAPDHFIPSSIHIAGHSSENLIYHFAFEDREFEGLFDKNKEILLGVHIKHTFADISKKEKTDFATGYLTLK